MSIATNKGQALTIDYVVGLMLFASVLTIAIVLIHQGTPDDSFRRLYQDNKFISSSLMTSGTPRSWDSTNLNVPGILTDNHLNLSKLSQFDSLQYSSTKVYFDTMYDYAFFFSNKTHYLDINSCVHGFSVPVAANCTPNFDAVDTSNLVKSERLVAHNGSIILLEVFTWD